MSTTAFLNLLLSSCPVLQQHPSLLQEKQAVGNPTHLEGPRSEKGEVGCPTWFLKLIYNTHKVFHNHLQTTEATQNYLPTDSCFLVFHIPASHGFFIYKTQDALTKPETSRHSNVDTRAWKNYVSDYACQNPSAMPARGFFGVQKWNFLTFHRSIMVAERWVQRLEILF